MKKSMILGAILAVSLTVLFVACSKNKDCECVVSMYDNSGYPRSVTVSINDYDGSCGSISWSEIMSHVGGDRTDFSNMSKNCYEK